MAGGSLPRLHQSCAPCLRLPTGVQVKAWPDALRVALRLDSREKVVDVLGDCLRSGGPDAALQLQQLAYILASQVPFSWVAHQRLAESAAGDGVACRVLHAGSVASRPVVTGACVQSLLQLPALCRTCAACRASGWPWAGGGC